jgi:hypothetical protein
MNIRVCRIGHARPLEPHNRLVGVGLHQMHEPNAAVPIPDGGIVGTEAHGPLVEPHRAFDRSSQEFARAERGYCAHPVTIAREHGLVLGNGLLEPVLITQQLVFGEMPLGAARRHRQGLPDQPFCARQVGHL